VNAAIPPDTINRRWRVGRSLGRTIYLQAGDHPTKRDILLGLMETRELAMYIVTLHNRRVGHPEA
jgi:hypothetical protein